MHIKLEICAYSVQSVIAAEKAGAHRVELCSSLLEGGITPSAAAIELSKKLTSIPVYVMIRPRGGDFLYSDLEYNIMKRDIEQAKDLGADGVVFGILNANGTVDIRRTALLVELASPMGVTFHRAFDRTPNPLRALEDIISTGAERILTSGQRKTALEGASLLSQLVEIAGDRITIMPGSGINENNIAEVFYLTRASEYHCSGKVKVESVMKFVNPKMVVNPEDRLPNFDRYESSPEKISKAISILKDLQVD